MSSKMEELSTVCCGCSLKTGTVVIGVMQAILAFTLMILTAAYADNPHELLDMSDPSIVPDLHTLKALLIIISVASALQCAFSIMIIFGAETNRPLLLLPWLIFNPIAIAIYAISTVVGMVHHKTINNSWFIAGHLLVGINICVIGGFKILTVYKYYKHLKSLNF